MRWCYVYTRRRVKGGAAKEQRVTSVACKQMNEAVLRTEETVLDTSRRNSSWEVVDFEVDQGVDPIYAQKLLYTWWELQQFPFFLS